MEADFYTSTNKYGPRAIYVEECMTLLYSIIQVQAVLLLLGGRELTTSFPSSSHVNNKVLISAGKSIDALCNLVFNGWFGVGV